MEKEIINATGRSGDSEHPEEEGTVTQDLEGEDLDRRPVVWLVAREGIGGL